ncbi:fucolectin-4-like, partial [Aplysia californica]|uniref:Fucolectin-4-like n=1 Tax=Aplysia californica TaxID=6500 RepID=A0ABM1VSX7_APLCA
SVYVAKAAGYETKTNSDDLQTTDNVEKHLEVQERSFSLHSQHNTSCPGSPTFPYPVNGLDNVALRKPSEQSSTRHEGYAKFGNDGDSSPFWDSGSCCHTHGPQDQALNRPTWWMVDLLQPFTVYSVKVTNRVAYYWRLEDFFVYVSERNPQDDPAYPEEKSMGKMCVHRKEAVGEGETVLLSCGTPVIGRFVIIFNWSIYGLVFCEFQVFAQVVTRPTNEQLFMTISAGRKSSETPLISKQGVKNVLQCARVCVWEEERREVGNALQYKTSTSL